MKKIFFFLFLVWLFFLSSPVLADCNPPYDYISCPQSHPDLNLEIRGYQQISGQLQYIPFEHPIDPKAPQLSTLLENTPQPIISNLYQVNDWNWETNTVGGPIPRPPDLPLQYDWATLVGFSASPGQAVLVPASGYDLGDNLEVIILYATPTSIVLHYTAENSVANGYTIHLQNLRVDSNLLNYYRQLVAEGSEFLPALGEGMRIGEAMGELLVAIRDTGSFMDPRWREWFQKLDPVIAKNLILKKLKVQKVQKYGACQADEPFKAAPITKGESFIATISAWFGSPQEPAKTIQALLKILQLDFPKNQTIASHLHQKTLKRLTPPNYFPVVQKKSSLGKITYEVCEQGTNNWFSVEKEIEFKTPEWTKEMANTGEELAKMLLPKKTNIISMENSLLAINNSKNVLGENITNNNPLFAQANNYSMSISPQISRQGGNKYSVCWIFHAQANCGLFDLSGNLSVSVGGKGVYSSLWGPVATSFPYECTYSPFPGPISVVANPGESINICVNVTNLNHQCKEDPRPFLSGCASCLIGSTGEIINCGGTPMPTPTPRMCEGYFPQGEKLLPEVICVLGECFLKDRISNPTPGILQSLIDLGLTLEEALQQILPFHTEKTYIITPQIQTPYTWESDQYLRNEVFSIFKVPSEDAQEAFKFTHALQNSTQYIEASPGKEKPILVEIFGQAGVKKSFGWVQKALLPYNSSSLNSSASVLDYSLPFRDSSITIKEENKQNVIEMVRNSWPDSQISNQWDFVYNQAVNNGWNPAFVIALWIEESGASGVDAYDLGCLGGEKNNLSSQLECLFTRPYANQSFEEFMCQYSEGKPAPCSFATNPNFPRNLKYWYDLLTR
ncbi:MAG: hypothetical protein ACPLKP_02710 [Microgenomates group bacterium]